MKKESWLTLAVKLGQRDILKRYRRQALAKLNMLYSFVWRSYLSQSDFRAYLLSGYLLLSQNIILEKWSLCVPPRCNALLQELKQEPETSCSYRSVKHRRSFGCLAMLISFSFKAFVDFGANVFCVMKLYAAFLLHALSFRSFPAQLIWLQAMLAAALIVNLLLTNIQCSIWSNFM